MVQNFIAPGLAFLALLTQTGCYQSHDFTPPPEPSRELCPMVGSDIGAPGTTTVETIDFEWENSEGGFSRRDEPIYVHIPADLVGLTLAVEDGRHATGFVSVALEGESLVGIEEDGLWGLTPPFFHLPVPVSSVTFPMNATTSLGEGCLAIAPFVRREAVGEGAQLHIVSRRRPPGGDMPVQVVLVGSTRITPSDLDDVIVDLDRIYRSNGGPGISDYSVHSLAWPSSIVGLGRESDELRAAFSEARPDALQFFLVQDFVEFGILGFSPGIPGPNGVTQTASSGVMISVDGHLLADGRTLDLDLMGETFAHEAAHLFGLFHTSEDIGDLHDGIGDTPECLPEHDMDGDRLLNPDECLSHGGSNLMFWAIASDRSQDSLTAEQVLVLNRSPYPVPTP